MKYGIPASFRGAREASEPQNDSPIICKPQKVLMDAKVPNYTGWQSDVIVDCIKRYDFPNITLNPGASFRGPA